MANPKTEPDREGLREGPAELREGPAAVREGPAGAREGPAGVRDTPAETRDEADRVVVARRRPRSGPRHFRSGYEIGVPVLLGVIVLLLIALIVLVVLVLFHLVTF